MPSQQIHATVHADIVVEGQEVQGKLSTVGPGYVVGNDVPKGSGHYNGSELGVVRFILVLTKEVRICEVRFHACINREVFFPSSPAHDRHSIYIGILV